jgi:CTP:molybdopterin cytidylyltransferase MocA
LANLTSPLTDVLVCPVDRPGWDQAVLERLLATPGEAVVPVHDGRAGHPLLVRGQALSRLAALDVDAPLRQALDERRKVEVDAPFLHVNLDRPDDVAVMPALAAWLDRGENP